MAAAAASHTATASTATAAAPPCRPTIARDVDPTDIFSLLAKHDDGDLLPLADLGRLALTTSKTVRRTISGGDADDSCSAGTGDPWLCLCRRRLGADLIRQLDEAGLLHSHDGIAAAATSGEGSNSKKRKRNTLPEADTSRSRSRSRSRYEQLFRLLVLNDMPQGRCSWQEPPPLTVDPDRPRIPRLDPLEKSLDGYTLVVQIFEPERRNPDGSSIRVVPKRRVVKRKKATAAETVNATYNLDQPKRMRGRRPNATLVVTADRLQDILFDGYCQSESFALDRPVLFDAITRAQFEDRGQPDDWTCGVWKEEDAWHAAAHGRMFDAFDANRPDEYRWDVVMHLLHCPTVTSGDDHIPPLSGLCVHETDHGGSKMIDFTNGHRDDETFLSPLKADLDGDHHYNGVLETLFVCGKELPLEDDAIRYFERLNFEHFHGFRANDDGSYTHEDVWTGISFGIELVCDVVDLEGQKDRVGLCFREIGLSVELEDVDGSYVEQDSLGRKESFGYMGWDSKRRTTVAHILEKARGWNTI